MKALGFSLIELIIVLAVLGIGLALALPSIAPAIERTEAATTASRLQLALNQARLGAINSSLPTVVCPSLDRLTCSRSIDWRGGVLLFADANNDGQRQPDEPLQQYFALGNHPVFSSTGRIRARFLPDGTAHGANLTLTVCAGDAQATRLIIANAGRIRIERARAEPRC